MRVVTAALLAVALAACDYTASSNRVQQQQQELILSEGTAQVGMPGITNFRERRLMRDILEMRDRENVSTYTYLAGEMQGVAGDLLCNSIGYPIPYATQYTNPQKLERPYSGTYVPLPQADPNGLFSPASAEGSWVMCQSPTDPADVGVVYSEPRLIVSPFPLK